jgi:5,5'-dehydrodivanillate O-demethylase
VQKSIPAWYGPIKDADGRWISSHVMNQDFIAWVGQGAIADRTKEHLSSGDRGVILLRQRLMDDLTAIENGQDPKGLIRDAAVNHRVPLPVAERRYLTESLNREELLKHPVLGKQYMGEYPFQAGQPDEVRRAYEEAIGIRAVN